MKRNLEDHARAIASLTWLEVDKLNELLAELGANARIESIRPFAEVCERMAQDTERDEGHEEE